MTISKKYPEQEEENFEASSLREPAAVYGTNLNSLKVEVIPEAPCQFTAEEKDALLDRAEADVQAGNAISADEMKRRVLNKYLHE